VDHNEMSTVEAYWSVPAQTLLTSLRSSPSGLSFEEAQSRLRESGPNAVSRTGRASALAAFARQFRSPLVLILIFAASVSAFVSMIRRCFLNGRDI